MTNNPHSPYIVNIEDRTVIHKPTGIVMRFDPHPDSGWSGLADKDTIPADVTNDYLSRLARRMGDAWAETYRRSAGES